jgi:glycerol-3-phosphate dehydrogenase
VREYACTAIDVIGRRLRLAFLNVQAAEECLPHIIDVMAEELKWDNAEKKVHDLEISCFETRPPRRTHLVLRLS